MNPNRMTSRVVPSFLLASIATFCYGAGQPTTGGDSASLPADSVALTRPGGQVEITRAVSKICLESEAPTMLELGFKALDPLVAPRLGGQLLANRMPTGSVLLIRADGTATFSYTDRYRRHFRAREQHLVSAEDGRPIEEVGGIEFLLDLPPEAVRPKVLRDLYGVEGEMAFNDSEDLLWWTGDLIYEFDLGLPVLSLRLADRDGQDKTMVGDWDWQSGRAITIAASNDTFNWVEIWRSSGEGGRREVDAEVPPELLGDRPIYLKFHAEDGNALFDLFVSAVVDATALLPNLRLDAGRNMLTYADEAESSHHAVVFWDDPQVRHLSAAPQPPQYPKDRPVVIEKSKELTVLFPDRVGIALERREGDGVTGIRSLSVEDHQILSAPAVEQLPVVALEVLELADVGGVTDWVAYLAERKKNGGRFPILGGRERHSLALTDAEYLGSYVVGDSVVIRTRVEDAGEIGELEWILSPEQRDIGGRVYRGVGWSVRLTGLPKAEAIRLVEPVATSYGDWSMQQRWGGFVEGRLDHLSSYEIPRGWFFGDRQPFFFTGGPSGSVVSCFDEVIAARGGYAEEDGRILVSLKIPLGTGFVRETPRRVWLWSEEQLGSRWQTIDEWTSVCDAVARHYQDLLGVGVTEPVPVLWTQWPGEEYFEQYRRDGTPTTWLDDYREEILPVAAELGIRSILIDGHWEVDAMYPEEDYLPGSGGAGSAEAPWSLEISDAVGREPALRRLCDAAHDVGVEIMLWSCPADLANNSPLLREYPEWLKWQRGGVPEKFAYDDVTGTSLRTGFYDYALDHYRSLGSVTGYDGIWLDSFLTFCMFPDFREVQPTPQLDCAVTLQQELWAMGMTQVLIEGCGPLGLSTSGYGYEDDPEAALAKIRGREYGLYRYVADCLVEPDSYYRALASKGVIGLPSVGSVLDLPPDDGERIVQANRDYRRVLPMMERRHLVARGDDWLGVAWTREGSENRVLFAFDSFAYAFGGPALVIDVTTGREFEITGSFEAKPWHTYVIQICE